MNGVPAVIIDGVETLLSDQKGFAAVKLAKQRMDTYILVNNVLSDSGRSMLYKNMQQVNLPINIAIPENLLKYYTQYGTTINAVELGITDIAKLKTRTNNYNHEEDIILLGNAVCSRLVRQLP